MAASCLPDRVDLKARVTRVLDGDTIELEERRRVRLIGLNAPELGHEGKPGEPLGESAKDALRAVLASQGNRVILRFGKEVKDRYGRTLAHAFLPNGQSLSASLLSSGMATLLVVPPNTWNIPCYVRAEEDARNQRRGLWSLPQYQVIETTALPRSARGYRLLKGSVVRVGQSRRAIWLNLQGDVALRIDRADLKHFEDTEFDRWPGAVVLARGWVYLRRGERRMQIRHPVALQRISAEARMK